MSEVLIPVDEAAQRAEDAAARRLAQTCFDAPVVLEAGAGTGKTTTLVARLLAWCLGPGWTRAEAACTAGRSPTATPRQRADTVAPDRIAAQVLGGVVAMTFTDAAAAEMAVRFGEALVDAESGRPLVYVVRDAWPSDVEVAPRARALLGNLERLEVRTIHAFCRRLLAAHPLSAGLHPGFQVDAQQDLLPEVVTEVVEEMLGMAYAQAGAPGGVPQPEEATGPGEVPVGPALAMAADGIGPSDVQAALVQLAQEAAPVDALTCDAFPTLAVENLRLRLVAAIAEFQAAGGGRLALAPRSKAAEEAVTVFADLGVTLVRLAGEGPDLAAAMAEAVETAWEGTSNAARKRPAAWAKGAFNKGETKVIGEAADDVQHAAAAIHEGLSALGSVDPHALVRNAAVLAPMLVEVYRRLDARGIVSFSALLGRAERLLVAHPEVAATERRRIQQLLVDEFQDTDPRQCSLVRVLALDGPPEVRPGLFIVGDPKQSIYGFRNADLRAYEQFLDLVRAAGGTVNPLMVNFRSVPAVLDQVQRIVGPVMVREVEVQPAFQPLLAAPHNADATGYCQGRWAPVELWHVAPDRRAKPGTAVFRPIEAQAVAEDIAEVHAAGGVSWADFAILFRSGSDLPLLVDALRDAGVPYRVERDKSYFQRREVVDAAALVRWTADPSDHLAMVTWLRSPLVGVPDAALLPLWHAGLPHLLTALTSPDPAAIAAVHAAVDDAVAATPSGPDVLGGQGLSGWPVALKDAVVALAEARRCFATLPADRFLHRLRALFLVEGTESSRYQGHYRVANVDRFFRQLVEVLTDPQRPGDVHLALRRLREAVRSRKDAEEARPKDGADDAVALMTIHKAKGLDFGHTYFVQLDRGPNPNQGRDSSWAVPVGDGWALRLLGAQNLGVEEIAQDAERVEAAERVRTLYVAATRAKVRLVLSGDLVTPHKPLDKCDRYSQLLQHRTGGFPSEALLALLPPAPDAPDGPGEAEAEPPPTGPAWVDHLGARFVAPVRWVGQRARTQGAEVALPAPRAGALDMLQAHQAAAAARMARPLTAPAAHEAHARLSAVFDAPDAETGVASGPGGGPDTSPPPDWVPEVLPGLPWSPALNSRARQQVAMAAGSAVHLVLERFALDTPLDQLDAELDAQLGRLDADLAALVDAALIPAARARADAILARLRGGTLLSRLVALGALDAGGGVVGREVPLLLPAAPGPVGSAPEEGPVFYRAGAIDLLYVDRTSGALVVADFKTDWVLGPALAARALVYRSQGDTYAAAVQRALALPQPPRVELWFVAADTCFALPPLRPPGPAE